MIYGLTLIVHIIGACVTGVIASYAGVVMYQRQDHSYRMTAITLGTLGGFEVLTGTLLSVISPQITSISLCANIIAYMSVVLFVEALLYMKMKKVSILFPLIRALTPIIAGLTVLLSAIAYGF